MSVSYFFITKNKKILKVISQELILWFHRVLRNTGSSQVSVSRSLAATFVPKIPRILQITLENQATKGEYQDFFFEPPTSSQIKTRILLVMNAQPDPMLVLVALLA